MFYYKMDASNNNSIRIRIIDLRKEKHDHMTPKDLKKVKKNDGLGRLM